jgi:hypothetical protein
MTDPIDDAALEALFDEVRGETPVVSDDLMARILSDAEHALPSTPVESEEVPGFWAQIFGGIGGWPAISGLAAATVAGVWIGVAPPDGLNTLASSYFGTSVTVDFLPDYDILALEG